MKANVGNVDRLVRAIIGVVVIWLTSSGTIGVWGWVVGVVLLATAILKFCPAYTMLGMNTCAVKDKEG